MKRGALIFNILIALLMISQSFMYHIPVLAGVGAVYFVYVLFKFKNYSMKFYPFISGAILLISLIFSFIQLSSPLFQGNRLLNYLLAVFFVLVVILNAYDITHDYKFSKIIDIKDQQLRNQNQRSKDIIAISLLVVGLIVGLLIGIYFPINY